MGWVFISHFAALGKLCDPWRTPRSRRRTLGALGAPDYQRYRAPADFLTVYIREAHALDEWQMTSNERDGICYRPPRTTAARVAIANDFVTRFHYDLPLVVDPIENPADQLYAGWPERFYIVTERGIITYKGETGPFGFHPEEVEAWLQQRFPTPAAAPGSANRETRRPTQQVTQ